MERESIKVIPKFHDDMKYVCANPKFPLQNLSQLFTLATWKWVRDFEGASNSEKQQMIQEMIKLREKAEDAEYLHHSREIVEVADE